MSDFQDSFNQNDGMLHAAEDRAAIDPCHEFKKKIDEPDSVLDRERLALPASPESQFAVSIAARRARRIRVGVTSVLAAFCWLFLIGFVGWDAVTVSVLVALVSAIILFRVEAMVKAGHEIAAAKEKLPIWIHSGLPGTSIDVPLYGKVILQMCWCPPGFFTVGSPESEGGRSGDEMQVSVTLSKGFWLAGTELTQTQWKAVMGSNPSHFKGGNLPVEKVSWDDAQRFIAKVNARGFLPKNWIFALPTEAQWEYACRAGTTGPFSGESLDDVGWFDGNSGGKTHPVGTKKPNAWGFHDMHGNVWEWCADWYDNVLPGGSDPTGPDTGLLRVGRGGSWGVVDSGCRSAIRYWSTPGYRNSCIGFRVAVVPIEPATD